MGRRLCAEMEQEALRLAGKGYSFREIGRQLHGHQHLDPSTDSACAEQVESIYGAVVDEGAGGDPRRS